MFFYVLIILAILVTILLFSEFKINIKNIKVSTEKIKGRVLGENYSIIVSWNILKKLPILKINITKEKLEELNLQNKIKKIDITKIKFKGFDKKKIKEAQKYKPQIEYINLYMDIGLDNAVLTSYIVAIISTIFGITLKQQLAHSKENRFIINPIYSNKNLLNLELNCIFKIKLLHIIYIIYILKKKRRDDKYVRTSNRRTYGYSYE